MSSSQELPASTPESRRNKALLLCGIILLTLNLRGAITGVGPMLEAIQAEYGLNGSLAGLLSSLPLFAFAFVSPYAAVLARRMGMERALFLALLLLGAGILLRYLSSVFWLFGGTVLIGISIAVCNVLVPGLIRREFQQSFALVTAVFTMILVSVGGLGSALAVPLSAFGGWRISLLAWGLPVLLALAGWWPQLRRQPQPVDQVQTVQKQRGVWHSALAWQVSLFMGCQSTAFYVMIAWLPSMLSDVGISASTTGWILFIYQVFVLFSVMLIPLLVKHLHDQRLPAAGCALLILCGYTGLQFAAQKAMLWMSIMGLGAGGSLVLALTFFGLRASSTVQSVSLSGMAQSVGYLMAAVMPVVLGGIHDLSNDWSLPLWIMMGFAVLQIISGYLAGRPLTLDT